MIYCNKRKEHIKPEVGQLWASVGKLTPERFINKYKIVFINKYAIVCEDAKFGNVTTHINDKKVISIMFDYMIQEAPKPPSPWQPIETAPRDGTRILVYKGYDSHIVWFNGGKFVKFNCDDDWYSVSFYEEELTHWMPLPEPPEPEGA